MLHEIRILEQTHRRDVDRRDAVLQMLDRDIEEADEQYLVIVRATLSDIDKLLEVQVRKRDKKCHYVLYNTMQCICHFYRILSL